MKLVHLKLIRKGLRGAVKRGYRATEFKLLPDFLSMCLKKARFNYYPLVLFYDCYKADTLELGYAPREHPLFTISSRYESIDGRDDEWRLIDSWPV